MRFGALLLVSLAVAVVIIGAAGRVGVLRLEEARVRSVGAVLARTAAHRLAFSRDEEAFETVRAAADEPGMVAVILYDTRGRVLAAERGSAVRATSVPSASQEGLAAVRPVTIFRELEGRDVLESWTPVVRAGRRLGTVSVAYDRREASARIRAIWGAAALVAGLLALFGTAATVVVAGPLTRPTERLAEGWRALAAGDLAVSFEVEPASADGLASLSGDLDKVVADLRELVAEADDVGTRLQTASRETLEQAEAEAEAGSQQAASNTELSATMQELEATVASISARAGHVAEVVTTAQMSVERGLGAVHEVRERMDEIRDGSRASAQQAGDLAAASHRISEIVGIINEIARRTKILAVNAAIEAARARGAGTGFHVVAVEVRQLADSVVASTKEIEQTVDQFSGAIRRIVEDTRHQEHVVQEGAARTEEADNVMREIEQLAGEAASAAQEISFGMQQQGTGVQEAAAAARQVAQAAQQLADTGSRRRGAAADLARLSERVVALARRFRLS